MATRATRSAPTLLQVLNGERPSLTAPVNVTMLPGLTFRYSPAGYAIVQQLVEDLTGQPFEDQFSFGQNVTRQIQNGESP